MHDVLKRFAFEIIQEKNLDGVDEEVKEQLAEDMAKRLNDQINRAIISKLNPEQLSEFEHLLESAADPNVLQEFLANAHIDTEKIAAEVMTKFRAGYLGG